MKTAQNNPTGERFSPLLTFYFMRYHTTKEGKRMLISDMTDAHLEATIELSLTHLRAAQNIIKSEITENGNLDLIGS